MSEDLNLDDAETRQWMDAPGAVAAVLAPSACAVPMVGAKGCRRASEPGVDFVALSFVRSPGD
jgi:hypothetical protein